LVQWVKRLAARGQIGVADAQWRLVFMPISMRFNTNLPEVFYEAIVARLAEIVGEDLEPQQAGPSAHYEDRCRSLLDIASGKKIQILLIIDGLDEALGGRFVATWFPRSVESRLRLLVSARLEAGDQDASGWVKRLGWESGVRVEKHDLPALDLSGIADLVRTSGGPIEQLTGRSEIIKKLSELTAGEPLLLRLYVEDLSGQTEGISWLRVEDLDRIKPGWDGYFKDWVERQREVWEREGKTAAEREKLYAYLAVLACAHGPLSADLLSDLTHRAHQIEPGFRIQDALNPIRRFVMSRKGEDDETGYVLTHPKFGDFLREDFGQKKIRRTLEAFAEWGRDIVRRLKSGELEPGKTPAYLLSYFGQHLEDVGADASEFIGLVEEGWLRAWTTHEAGHRAFSQGFSGFLADVDRAWLATERSDQKAAKAGHSIPYVGAEVRCVLCHASINSLAQNIPKGLLAAFVDKRLWPPSQALAYARRVSSPDKKAAALSKLAPYLPDGVKCEIEFQVLEAVRAIEDINDRLWVIANVIPHLSDQVRTNELQRQLLAAEALEGWDRSFALGYLAPHLSDTLIEHALASVRSIQDERACMWALEDLAPHLNGPLLQEALAIARGINAADNRAYALIALVRYLPEAIQADLLQEALSATRLIELDGNRASALVALARYLPESLLREAIALAEAIGYMDGRVEALSILYAYLCEPYCCEDRLLMSKGLPKRPTSFYLPLPEGPVFGGRDAQRVSITEDGRVFLITNVGGAGRWVTQEITKAADNSILANEIWRIVDLCKEVQTVGSPILREPLKEAVARRVLMTVLTMEDINRKAATLIALAPLFPAEVLREALEMAINIWDDEAMVRVLVALAPRLPEPLLHAVFERAQFIRDEFLRSSAMVALARYLPEARIDELLGAMRSIQNVDNRTYALDRVTPYLPASLLPTALDLAEKIQDKKQQAWAFVALASNLPRALLDEALKIARALDVDTERAKVLVALAPNLPRPLLDEALKIARALNVDSERAKVLASLARHLPEPLNQKARHDALEVALAINDRKIRAATLAAIGAELPESGWQRAIMAAKEDPENWSELLNALAPRLSESSLLEELEAVRSKKPDTNDDLYRAIALSVLAAHVPEPLKQEALRDAIVASTATEPLDHRVELLVKVYSTLGPHLSEPLLDEALVRVRALKSPYCRGMTLGVLAPYLPKDIKYDAVDEALRAAKATESEGHWAKIIAAVIPELSEVQRREALTAAQRVESGEARVAMLIALSPHLSELGLQEALSAARDTKGGGWQAKAIAGLAPHLPDRLLPDALVITVAIEWHGWLEEAMKGLGPRLARLAPSNLLPLWQRALRDLAPRKREDVLAVVGGCAPVINVLGGEGASAETARAIQYVCETWR
jgi:hypothetical protein